MKRMYDWQALKSRFVAGDWLTLADFFKEQGIKNNSRSRLNARGWLEERRRYQERIILETQHRVIEDEVSIRSRQHKLAKQLQLKGVKELNKLNIRNADDARKLIVSGLEEEREALGINSKGAKTANLTQINLNLPKTRFDDILDSASYEDLLELIVEVRKEKASRSGSK